MIFLRQSCRLTSLRPCLPCRPLSIDTLLLNNTRVNCSTQQPSRALSTGRQCGPKLRPFRSSTTHLAIGLRHRHGRPPPQINVQDPEPQWQPPRWQPPSGRAGKFVVYSLAGACVFIFIHNTLLQAEARQNPTREARQKASEFYEHFVMSVRSLEPGRSYTLISSAFMHRDIVHLGMCMVGLVSLGRSAVMVSGVPSFLILYFGSALAGGVAQIKFWERNRSPHVLFHGMGSSGAISGLFGALACVSPLSQIYLLVVPMPMIVGVLVEVAVSVGGMQGRWLPDIAHADHLGGLAFGVIWAALAMKRGAPLGRLFRYRRA